MQAAVRQVVKSCQFKLQQQSHHSSFVTTNLRHATHAILFGLEVIVFASRECTQTKRKQHWFDMQHAFESFEFQARVVSMQRCAIQCQQ